MLTALIAVTVFVLAAALLWKLDDWLDKRASTLDATLTRAQTAEAALAEAKAAFTEADVDADRLFRALLSGFDVTLAAKAHEQRLAQTLARIDQHPTEAEVDHE